MEKVIKRNILVKVNGKQIKCSPDESGYISLHGHWMKGDMIEVIFDMPIHRVYTSEKIKANEGKVALMKGPVLYCLEGVDNKFDIEKMKLPASASLEKSYDSTILGGTHVLIGESIVENETVQFKVIPYYRWQNRGIYPMMMLLNEQDIFTKEERPDYEGMQTNG